MTGDYLQLRLTPQRLLPTSPTIVIPRNILNGGAGTKWPRATQAVVLAAPGKKINLVSVTREPTDNPAASFHHPRNGA